MGSRTLRRWITRPLKSREQIFDRHDAVDELTRSRAILEQMAQRLARISDLERLASRITLRSATPRECLTLADSLLTVNELAEVMRPLKGPLLVECGGRAAALMAGDSGGMAAALQIVRGSKR